MDKNLKRIAVTGGAGQIAYSLLFQIANGAIFGDKQPIALHILEVPEAITALKGVAMELQDCAFPLLKEIKIGSDPEEIFAGVNLAILVGSKPRGPGMERKDLLKDNGKIFIHQGKALNKVAAKDVLVFVVGNPCNTNCLIAMRHAPNIPQSRFHAMTRLDQNRAQFQLAEKAGVGVEEVTNVTIWGNHSSTQVPDFVNALIKKKPVLEKIADSHWLETTFFERVQKRGAEVIAARGKSSAASAAHAIIEGIKSLYVKTAKGHWFSNALLSDHNPYGVEKGLIFSFPCISKGEGDAHIVPKLKWTPFLENKIRQTEKELREEREMVQELLN